MFIIKQKSASGRINVHLAGSVHRPGRTPCHTRKHLGTLDSETGELLLSKKAEKPNAEILSLLSEKGISFHGRMAMPSGRPARPLAMACRGRAQVEEVGRVGALSHLAESSGLLRALQTAFGADDARRLLCAAMHQVCEGEPLYLLEDWMEGAAGSPCDGLSPSGVGALAREAGSKGAVELRRKFYAEWINACGKPRALIHDTTSISTYSRRLEDAEWGYNRDGEPLPQVNLALVVARDTRIPIWCRTLPGSVPDVASLQVTAAQLVGLGLKKFSFSLDRGYYSGENLSAMITAKISFTIGVPLHLKQVKELLRRHRPALSAFKRTFLMNGTLVSHVPCDITVSGKDKVKHKVAAHLYFCPERHAQMAESLGKAVLEVAANAEREAFESLSQARSWLARNSGGLAKYFGIEVKDGRPSIRLKANRVAADSKKFGAALIATSGFEAKADREEALAVYRSRDIAEKVFDSYKNATGNSRLRTGGDESAEGRIFIAFLAVTLRALMEEALRKSGMKKAVTVPEALALLRKIKRLWQAETPLLLEVPKRSREIAMAVGVATEDMAKAARSFAKETATAVAARL
jgi:hypothetical protein